MNYKQHNLISYLKHFQMKNTSMMIATITPITSPTVPIYSEVSVVGCIWLVATLEVELDGGVVVGSISVGSWRCRPRPDSSHACGGQLLRMRICISKGNDRHKN